MLTEQEIADKIEEGFTIYGVRETHARFFLGNSDIEPYACALGGFVIGMCKGDFEKVNKTFHGSSYTSLAEFFEHLESQFGIPQKLARRINMLHCVYSLSWREIIKRLRTDTLSKEVD